MSRPGLITSLLLVACNAGIGVTDASGITSSSSTAPSTGPAPGSSSSSSGGAPTTSETASGTAGATGGTGSTGGATSTSTGTTAASTGEPGTGVTSGGSGTGDPSTGEPVACVDVSGDYGACATILGYGFDGTTCRAFSGCDCAPNCELFSPDPLACATACAAAGECDEAKIQGAGIARGPVAVGSFCDQVDACTQAGAPLLEWLTKLFPERVCEPGFPCQPGQSCHLQFSGIIDAAQWSKLCAVSLLPGADLHCVVFGP